MAYICKRVYRNIYKRQRQDWLLIHSVIIIQNNLQGDDAEFHMEMSFLCEIVLVLNKKYFYSPFLTLIFTSSNLVLIYKWVIPLP